MRPWTKIRSDVMYAFGEAREMQGCGDPETHDDRVNAIDGLRVEVLGELKKLRLIEAVINELGVGAKTAAKVVKLVQAILLHEENRDGGLAQ